MSGAVAGAGSAAGSWYSHLALPWDLHPIAPGKGWVGMYGLGGDPDTDARLWERLYLLLLLLQCQGTVKNLINFS